VDGKSKSRTSAQCVVLKGADATPHLRRRARCVSGTFAHSRACPGETTAHSRDASVPTKYEPAESARGHDGTVTSVKSVEMLAPITAPTFTSTAITTPTKHPQATTATNTNKRSRASLQLTHELGGYIWRMRSRAPTENVKNTNTKIIRLSLSTTP
jgi:septal ring-binding cell division protein DamX